MSALLGQLGRPRAVDVTRYVWFAAAGLYVAATTASATVLSWDIWAALVIAPVLYMLTVPLLRFGLRKDPDPRIMRLVMVALVAKMFGAVARYALTFEVYAGRADADGYHGSGARLAQAFWDGTFSHQMAIDAPELSGTPFINFITGLVYIVTGPTKLGGFLVFAWLSFLGLFFFYKALLIGFPEANHRRYAVLLFFLPSLLYWPSSLGKEAWICFTLGLATYGVALILRHQQLGYPLAGLGLLGTAGPRPHITVLCFGALFVAYMLRRKSWHESTLGPVGKVVGVILLIGVGSLAVGKAASFFEVEGSVGQGGMTEVLDYTTQQSGQGGSEFEAVRVKSPVQLPAATLAVLFRPFPWEAGNAQALVAAAEGTVLLALFALSLKRMLRLPATMLRVPYVAYALAYVMMFVIAFSSISNFGIMTRQRTQVLPLVLVLLAIPVERRSEVPVPTIEQRSRQLAQAPRRPSPMS